VRAHLDASVVAGHRADGQAPSTLKSEGRRFDPAPAHHDLLTCQPSDLALCLSIRHRAAFRPLRSLTECSPRADEGTAGLGGLDPADLELAARTAHSGQPVGTRHILLGILDLREGVGAEVLDALSISRDDLRRAAEARRWSCRGLNSAGKASNTDAGSCAPRTRTCNLLIRRLVDRMDYSLRQHLWPPGRPPPVHRNHPGHQHFAPSVLPRGVVPRGR
jgi:hypothetical protein